MPDAVIDLKGIGELKYLEERDGAIYIGATVTWTELLESEMLKKSFPGLWEAADLVASVAVRNTATLVGNLCNAVPSLEGGSPLYVRDAVVFLEIKSGKKEVSIKDFLTGIKKTVIKDDEVMTGLKIPVEKDFGEVYIKMGRYEGEDLALEAISPISDLRSSKEYRLYMCRIMVKRGLGASVSRMETGLPSLSTRLI